MNSLRNWIAGIPPVWALVALLVMAFAVRVYRLEEPSTYYFDEVYYSFTAGQLLKGDRDIYNPWATPPKGLAYEWTHPPTPKLLMASAMALAGDNGFGWRIGSALLGTASIGLTALLAFELFASWPLALLAALLLSLEGLSLSMSRIGTGDAYFICFTLFSFLCYARWRREAKHWQFALAAFGLGLALSSKWTAVFPLLVIQADLLTGLGAGRPFQGKKWAGRWMLHAAGFGLILGLIYLLSYAHFFWVGWKWHNLVELQKQMYWYHSGLKNTHAYMSTPWSWIVNWQPVWFYSGRVNGMLANIFNYGNSVVLLAGLVAVIWQIKEKRLPWAMRFLILSYFMLWLPWAFSPRIMFFYHYAPAVPFLCVALARWVEKVSNPRRKALLVAAAALWFFAFYPINTALPLPDYINNYYFSLPPLERR